MHRRRLALVLLLLFSLPAPGSPRKVSPSSKGSGGAAARPSNPYVATIKAACPEEHAACAADGDCTAEMADSFGPRKWNRPPSALLETVVRCYRAHKQGGQQNQPRSGSVAEGTSAAGGTGARDPVRIADDVKCEVCGFATQDMLTMIVQQVATDRALASDGARGAKVWLDGLCEEPRPMIQRMIGLYDLRECQPVDIDMARLDASRPCGRQNQRWHAVRDPPAVEAQRGDVEGDAAARFDEVVPRPEIPHFQSKMRSKCLPLLSALSLH